MNTEIFIENRQLDISAELSSLLTFAIDDVKDFSSRQTTFSKAIILPGTANNNKLFGHIFEVGQSNSYDPLLDNVGYNFNASKSAACAIFQDHIQTFKGVLRLLQINIFNGCPEYEVSVFGTLSLLNVSLSSEKLEDLDFSAYDELWNETNIVASWDNPGGSGIYYPVADYGVVSGTAKHDWDIRNIRPAIYVKEYIDKMFAAAGFRYQSDLFDTARFEALVIPHNQKTLTAQGTHLLTASTTSNQTFLNNSPDSTRLLFQVSNGSLFTLDNPNPNTARFTYTGPTVNTTIPLALAYEWKANGNTIAIETKKNGVTIDTKTLPNTGGVLVTGYYTNSLSVTLTSGDYIEIWSTVSNSSLTPYLFTLRPSSLSIDSLSRIPVPLSPGDMISLNDTIPKNIRQVDFLVSIVKLFNLYVYEDRFDERLIYIKPYVDFYSTDSGNSVDWTYKLNRDKATKIKPMSELNAKKYEFKYKSDSDYYNEQYRKRYGMGYGDYTFDSEFEFAEQTKSFELIFSSTPLVGYAGEDKVYPTIFKKSGSTEEPIDSNIRIFQTKKVTGVTSWDILDGASVLSSVTDYGYGGHFDDPDAPSNDLNFGALNELFFILTTGALNVTQFNVYWSSYMAEITDKDSKLLIANFYLTPKDILELDFSKYVFVDGVLFRLNKITDYNATIPNDCEASLLRVINTLY